MERDVAAAAKGFNKLGKVGRCWLVEVGGRLWSEEGELRWGAERGLRVLRFSHYQHMYRTQPPMPSSSCCWPGQVNVTTTTTHPPPAGLCVPGA